MALTTDTLRENFALLDDWEARYAYVLDLGKKLPLFPEQEKTAVNLVKGCMSQVWLLPQPAEAGHVSFIADSDSHLVRGLIAVLMVIYDKHTVTDIAAFNIEEYFASLGLSEHLSPNRRNGFFAMVGRIKALA